MNILKHKKTEKIQLPGGISFEKYQQINFEKKPYTILIKQNVICNLTYKVNYLSIVNDKDFLQSLLNI